MFAINTGPGDYGRLVSQLVTFAPGSIQVIVPVSVATDNVVENPEFFTASATLVSSDAAVTVSPDTSFVNIQDNSSKSCHVHFKQQIIESITVGEKL